MGGGQHGVHSAHSFKPVLRFDLNRANWSFKQRDEAQSGRLSAAEVKNTSRWTDVDHVPTEAHLEARREAAVVADLAQLLKLGKIPDPFVGTNEAACQWVGECEWLFKCDFELDKDALARSSVDLVFDGLDTFATMYVDGKVAAVSDNQFVPLRVPIKPLSVGQHSIVIHFESAVVRGRQLRDEHIDGRKYVAINGEAARLFVRQAQYKHSWDWGPKLVTCGIWRPVRIEAYDARIEQFFPSIDLDEHLSATVTASFEAVGTAAEACWAQIRLVDPHGRQIFSHKTQPGASQHAHLGELPSPELWWPNGLGEQPLYTAELILRDADGNVLDQRSLRIGARRVRLIEAPLEDEPDPSRSFVFEINNVRMFMSGVNWIPSDSFYTRDNLEDKQRKLLKLAADSHMQMIRIWGGGVVHETDAFYDICDESGLLVWQDFGFACGMYPAYDEFLDSVRKEATVLVRAIRHRPSLALFAGNNEDYQVPGWEGVKWLPREEPRDSAFPAREIYERVLPQVVETELGDKVVYRFGSPYSGPRLAAGDIRRGDSHVWGVWHGQQESWRNWESLAGRFVSEFGMEGFPDSRTVDEWTVDKSERFPQSATTAAHQKAVGAQRRLAAYIVENLRVPAFDMDDYIYATQLVQSECITAAYNAFRRKFVGHGREYCSGALVWQLNDCWPVTSWSLIDYHLRPKPVYYALKRTLAPISGHITRSETTQEIRCFAFNATRFDRRVRFVLTSIELMTGKTERVEEAEVELPGMRSTRLGVFAGVALNVKAAVVYELKLFDVDNTVLHRSMNWPEPYAPIHWPTKADTQLSVDVDEEAQTIKISAARSINFAAESKATIDDNAIDLAPGETYTVTGTGLKANEVRWQHLGQYSMPTA